MITGIDVTFNFWTDTPEDQDPDARSPTLRRYHELLWSKPLPSGANFELSATTPGAYLHHRSDLGEFVLTSDTANSSYYQVARLSHIRSQVSAAALKHYTKIMYSIGNMIVFPGRRRERKNTINQERGCNRKIGDRFDLTLECIRRNYLYPKQESPLADALARYRDFFDLFHDFEGYVDFFLLNDLVSDDYSTVTFFLSFTDFNGRSPYPETADDFRKFVRKATEFIEMRNQRILEYANARGHIQGSCR